MGSLNEMLNNHKNAFKLINKTRNHNTNCEGATEFASFSIPPCEGCELNSDLSDKKKKEEEKS